MPDLQRAELIAIFEHTPLPMAVVKGRAGSDAVFAIANKNFRDFLELGAEPIIGRNIADVFNESDTRAIAFLLRPDVERKAIEFEGILAARHGGNRKCAVSARRVSTVERGLVLVTLRETKPAPEANGDHDSNSTGAKQREDFVATLTHDLKTPIVGANMVLTALLDGSVGQLQPAQSEIISKLRNSNQALLKMIQNLLEVYKYESGTESLRFDGANLAEIVRFGVDDVRPLADAKNIEMRVKCPSDEMLLICDEYAIKRVLINLLSNAIKFTPEHGTIEVNAIEEANESFLIVKDTGRGMSTLEKEHLFSRFWQGEPGRRYSAGTGIGLYFCYNVVKAHGGRIDCDSVRGVGTTFTIKLPRHVYAQ